MRPSIAPNSLTKLAIEASSFMFASSLSLLTSCGGGGGSSISPPPVQKITPTITWATPAAVTVGTALSSTQLDATASVAGTFVYSPAAGTVMNTVGTQTLSASFAPTDTNDYTTATSTVSLTVNAAPPSAPNITGISPWYFVNDGFTDVNQSVMCSGCQNGDNVHDPTGLFPDFTLNLQSGVSNFSMGTSLEQGTFLPWFDSIEVKHPGGSYGQPWSFPIFGLGNQSTLVLSATGTLFQDQENKGIYAMTPGGTPSLLPIGGIDVNPNAIASDDVTHDLVLLETAAPGFIGVYNESGTSLCYTKTSLGLISSAAAKGEQVVFTAPNDGVVGFISLANCSGGNSVPCTTIKVGGQPWAVSMINGTELDAYVLSRDKASANGLPLLTKINVATETPEGSVELTGFTPVTTVRAANPYAGLYQVQALNDSPIVAVLSSSDGLVLIASTNTASGAKMQITQTVAIPSTYLAFGIAPQESASVSTLWVAYVLQDSGEAITHIGGINLLMTGGFTFTPGVGQCAEGILAGGFVTTSNGVICAQGATIEPPLNLQL